MKTAANDVPVIFIHGGTLTIHQGWWISLSVSPTSTEAAPATAFSKRRGTASLGGKFRESPGRKRKNKLHRGLYRLYYFTFQTGRLISIYERYSLPADKANSRSIVCETPGTRVGDRSYSEKKENARRSDLSCQRLLLLLLAGRTTWYNGIHDNGEVKFRDWIGRSYRVGKSC